MAEKALAAVIQEAYIQGRTRSVDDLVQAMGMSGVSSRSPGCGEIDDKVNGFLDRSLQGDWPYLFRNLCEGARGRAHRLGRGDRGCGRQRPRPPRSHGDRRV